MDGQQFETVPDDPAWKWTDRRGELMKRAKASRGMWVRVTSPDMTRSEASATRRAAHALAKKRSIELAKMPVDGAATLMMRCRTTEGWRRDLSRSERSMCRQARDLAERIEQADRAVDEAQKARADLDREVQSLWRSWRRLEAKNHMQMPHHSGGPSAEWLAQLASIVEGR